MTVSFLLMPGASVLVSTRMQVLKQLRMFQCPVALGRQLEKMLSNVKFHYVANAGHQVQNDQPQLVAKLMMGFPGRLKVASCNTPHSLLS